MGIFTKNETVTTVGKSFAEQLTAIKESFRTAYNKADALNQKIEEDIKSKNTAIELLKHNLLKVRQLRVIQNSL